MLLEALPNLSKSELVALVIEGGRKLESAERERSRLEQENELLRQKLDRLARRIFGRSTEKLNPGQLEFLLGLQATKEEKAAAGVDLLEQGHKSQRARRRGAERRERWPDDLPVVEEIVDPEPVRENPDAFRQIGQEVSERLDYEPPRFLLRRQIRRKFVPKDGGPNDAPLIAPLDALWERSTPGPGLLAQILTAKFCDHLPLYRQQEIFASRHDVQIPRQTLARWVGKGGDWLEPIYQIIRRSVMAKGYAQVDETPIRYLDQSGGKAPMGYLWTACNPYGDVFFQ